tara:strand:+ start:359 stop:703 length:345 start_codon:yes stop_codon:yes gene_type:complete
MMTEDKIFLEFGADDYIVRLSPFKDASGNWTGELLVGTVVTEDNLMSDDDHYNLMNITKMVCAAVPAMEEDEQVRNTLIKIAERVESESETEEDIEPKTKIESVKENVINVNFN